MRDTDLFGSLRQVEGVVEVYQKTSFQCYRRGKAGRVQEVQVDILDAGADASSGSRYTCVAHAASGKATVGKPGPSVDAALATINWGSLD
jgi:hypothetical protein